MLHPGLYEQVITSHSGILIASSAFSHMNESPAWWEKGFVFCNDADENPYSYVKWALSAPAKTLAQRSRTANRYGERFYEYAEGSLT